MSDIETTRDGRIVERRRSGGAGWIVALLVIVALVVAAFAFGLINIDQTQSGKAPKITLETSGGQAPKFQVETAKVNVGQKEETVTVPTLSVEPADK